MNSETASFGRSSLPELVQLYLVPPIHISKPYPPLRNEPDEVVIVKLMTFSVKHDDDQGCLTLRELGDRNLRLRPSVHSITWLSSISAYSARTAVTEVNR